MCPGLVDRYNPLPGGASGAPNPIVFCNAEGRFPGSFQTAGTQVETAPEGIATRKGDPLGLKIGNAVQALYRNGKMQKILAKWHVSQFALKNG
jgi:hypothetical protein